MASLGFAYDIRRSSRGLTEPGWMNITNLTHYSYNYFYNGFGGAEGMRTVNADPDAPDVVNPVNEGFTAYNYGSRNPPR